MVIEKRTIKKAPKKPGSVNRNTARKVARMAVENEFNYPCPVCGYEKLKEKPITEKHRDPEQKGRIIVFNAHVCVNCASMFDSEIINDMKARNSFTEQRKKLNRV